MWEPGATVLDGRFRIVQAAGVSSGTEDYLAEQLSLKRKVTLRVIRPELGVQPDAAERFERELRKIAAVDHPGVVRVIDSGRFDKTMYLVTEQAEGTRLSAELKGSEPLLPERALEILTQVAEALCAVHHSGLVHGELNPAMVVVSGPRARLLDLGLARLFDAESPHERLTVATRTIAAPEYLAPEQLKGKDATQKSDVFALGALALRVLCGTIDLSALRTGHLAEQHGLIDLIARCVNPDPEQRPTTQQAATKLAKLPRPQEPTLFIEAMQRPPELPLKPNAPEPHKLLASVPMLTLTPAEPPSVVPPPLPPAAPRRKAWTLYAGGAVMIAASVAVAAMQLNEGPEPKARALLENRQPAQALELITKALRKQGASPSPELMALRVAALHLSEQHREEELTFKSLPAGTLGALDPLVLGGVMDDFGRKEDAGLRAALKALPAAELRTRLERLAQEPVSSRQWGALRYLDLENAASGLKRVQLYSISLESNSCAVRKLAAKRLMELDDDSAIEALVRLKDTPREGTEKSCGQDEAAAAVQALKQLK
jgi:tRNA A-37 threonylcarbamoyl transferase component Bud32